MGDTGESGSLQTASARQHARAEAHRLLDAESTRQAGARAAGLIAAGDGYDELAVHLLSSIDDAGDFEVFAALQAVQWRLGSRGLAHIPPGRQNEPPWPAEGLRRLVETAIECALPEEAGLLMEDPRAQTVHCRDAPFWVTCRKYLESFRAADAVGGIIDRDGDVAVFVSLPTGQLPAARDDDPPRTASRAADADSWRQRAVRWLQRLGATAGHARARAIPHVSGSADSLPQVPSDVVVVLEGGIINRYTARHWIAALERWGSIIVHGLTVHDTSVCSSGVVAALRRHEPIAVLDQASFLLLREWGVKAVIDAATLSSQGPHKLSLWNDPGRHATSLSWSQVFAETAQASDLEAVRLMAVWRQWAAESAVVIDDEVDETPVATRSRLDVQSIRPHHLLSGDLPGGDIIEVALAVDQCLQGYLPAVIEGCLESASLPLRFHVLTRGIGNDVLSEWQRLFEGRALIVVYPMDAVSYGDSANLIKHTTVSTLDRLLLPDLLPAHARVIYLDIDLVVKGDLAELWRLDLSGHALAARASSSPGTRSGIQMLYHAIGKLPISEALRARQWLHATGSMSFRAFNAGVLVLDLARMRRDEASARLLALVQRFAMNDQDALNTYVRGSYRSLPTAWNAAPRQDVTDGAKIIHFVGPVKPWNDLYISRKFEFDRVFERVERRRRELGLA